jgi:hypothetical protein
MHVRIWGWVGNIAASIVTACVGVAMIVRIAAEIYKGLRSRANAELKIRTPTESN